MLTIHSSPQPSSPWQPKVPTKLCSEEQSLLQRECCQRWPLLHGHVNKHPSLQEGLGTQPALGRAAWAQPWGAELGNIHFSISGKVESAAEQAAIALHELFFFQLPFLKAQVCLLLPLPCRLQSSLVQNSAIPPHVRKASTPHWKTDRKEAPHQFPACPWPAGSQGCAHPLPALTLPASLAQSCSILMCMTETSESVSAQPATGFQAVWWVKTCYIIIRMLSK